MVSLRYLFACKTGLMMYLPSDTFRAAAVSRSDDIDAVDAARFGGAISGSVTAVLETDVTLEFGPASLGWSRLTLEVSGGYVERRLMPE